MIQVGDRVKVVFEGVVCQAETSGELKEISGKVQRSIIYQVEGLEVLPGHTCLKPKALFLTQDFLTPQPE